MGPAFSRGDKVQIVGSSDRIGVIDGPAKEIKGGVYYPVSFDPREQSQLIPQESLEAFVRPRGVADLLRDRDFVSTDKFLTALVYKKLEQPLTDNLYTFYSSRTEFQVHQFKPVVKFLDSVDQRLFIADEVGIGKTIESGIILTELSARLAGLSRVLVVCPSMLTDKWQQEMERRFGESFVIARREQLEQFLEKYAAYGEHQPLKPIVSLQLLRQRRFLQRLTELRVHFDLIIIDEAHHMRNPETVSSDLGEILSELSDAMLMLSATPLNLGSGDLFNLLRILVPTQFSDFSAFMLLIEPNQHINAATRLLQEPDRALEHLRRVEEGSQGARFVGNPYYDEVVSILDGKAKLEVRHAVRAQRLLSELNTLSHVFTRTRKRDVATAFPLRKARVLTVRFTPEEMDFYNSVTQYVETQFVSAAGSGQGISFARIMPQRQVASCMPAMKQYLQEIVRKRLVKAARPDDGDVIDPGADEDDQRLSNAELQAARQLLSSARRVGTTDTKFDVFLAALRELEAEAPDAKILVFSFFKKTLEYLYRRLSATEYVGKVSLIHGDIKPSTRQKIIRRFRETEKIKLLLSSEVGGEGLDFEFCSVIFNFDLPWNPMRVEQRIGRLDRYGQQHETILIYNFSMEGTIDSEILRRLYNRINIFEAYIGDLEAILGDQIAELTREIFNPNLTDGQKAALIEKAAENIVRRKDELEKFEQESRKFVGQDEYFDVEISEMLKAKRFITPDDVERFVRTFIKTHSGRTTLRPPKSGRKSVYVLKADDEFRKFAWAYTQGDDFREPVLAALDRDGGTLVTFDSQEACRDQSLMFLTVHHPIVKAMKRYYDKYPEDIGLTGVLRLRGCPEVHGAYFFFIYLLEKRGLKHELRLVPILIGIAGEDSHWLDAASDWFMAHIMDAEERKESRTIFDDAQLEAAVRESEEYMHAIREAEEEELRRRNDVLIDNRIESMRQATSIKIQRVEKTLSKLRADGRPEDDSIVRLHKGRIANLKERAESQIGALGERRTVVVSFRLVLGGVVQLD